MRYRMIERNALAVPGAYELAGGDELAELQATADERVRGCRSFYSVDIVDRRTRAVVYTARGTE